MDSRPRNLVTGGAILLTLGVLALVAPFLATDQPLLAKDHGRLRSPALASALGRNPQQWDRRILAAPVRFAPNHIQLDEALEGPSRKHWLGTDALGRDLLSRIIHGGRVSLSVGLLAALFAILLGVPLGATAGYLGGWADATISRVIEAVLCFPSIVLVLVLLASDPAWLAVWPPPVRVAIVIGVTGWVGVARYMRGEFLKLRDSDMVSAARASGASHVRIALLHILPCALAPVLVTASFTVAAAIMLEAGLSFLGVGVPAPTATWGGLLHEAREQVHQAWWLALFPGVVLFLAILSCNLIGEGVRDVLDPGRRRAGA